MLRGIVDNGDAYVECVMGKNVEQSILSLPHSLISLPLAS